MKRKVLILGTRGIPGNHGGFETFAERLSLYLVQQGWEVSVYCQSNERHGKRILRQKWRGIDLIHIPCRNKGAFWSILFDFQSTLHALNESGVVLVFGYNTAIFSLLYRLKQRITITNMDGMEWLRDKWNGIQKSWLFLNERCGVWFSDRIIADHPKIADYYVKSGVKTEKIATIPYGTEAIGQPNPELLKPYQIERDRYALVIARPEPENSILEIVTAFSRQKRGYQLVILGRYLPETISYHAKVLAAASDEVKFVGGIYDKDIVDSLRYYARIYVHGHTVGGTNPSLVEALAAGTPVLAHNNDFNLWVAGKKASYFSNEAECAQEFTRLLDDSEQLQAMRTASWERYHQQFADNQDLKAYENLLLSFINQGKSPTALTVPVHKKLVRK
jgi:glycosyltransferase involved in cell wall biosynthesis